MSLEQLKAFLAKVKEDSNLQEKLKAAKSTEDAVAMLKSMVMTLPPTRSLNLVKRS